MPCVFPAYCSNEAAEGVEWSAFFWENATVEYVLNFVCDLIIDSQINILLKWESM